MARPRLRDKHLPAYVRQRHGAFWYEPRGSSPVRLGETLPEAMAKYHEIVGRPDRIETMEHVFDRYAIDVLPRKSAETQRKYRASLVMLRAFFGRMRPAAVEPQHIYQYLDQRAETPVAANRDVAVLSDAFAHAMRWGAVKSNPCIGVHRHSEHPRTRDVTDAELSAWCHYAPPLLACYTALKALTAMRQQDLLALTVAQATHPDGIEYVIQKTLRRDRAGRLSEGKRILLTQTPDLREAVSWCLYYRGDTEPGPLFRTRQGQHYTGSGFRAIWQRCMRKAVAEGVIKKVFTDHDIRAKAASDADRQGIDATRLLGHADARVTRRHYLRAPTVVTPPRKGNP